MQHQQAGSFPQFAVCIDNSNYESSLELYKIYLVVGDSDAAEDGDIRIIDDTGEDHLYAASRFLEIEIPQPLARAMLRTAS